MDIASLTKRVVDFREARNWKQFHKPKDMMLALLAEAGELAEHFKWVDNTEISNAEAGKKEEIADELSDVLYWTLLMANDLDIDLGKHFETKMQQNEEKYPIEKAKDSFAKYDKL